MSCSPFDLRDFFLKELSSPQQLQVEAHVKTCDACREEVEQLRFTEAALFSLRDEEIPQRIAFVSDPIFEPSPVRRWFSSFWGSAARLGFASAAMLSVAITFSVWQRTPAPAPGVVATASQQGAVVTPISQEDIDKRIQASVAKAVADVAARYEEKSRLQLAEFQQTSEETRNRLLLVVGDLETAKRRTQVNRTASMERPLDGKAEVIQ